MKKLPVALLLVLIYSCSSKKTAPPRPFSSEMLPYQHFRINTDRDTTLQTLHGSLITVLAGSFEIKGDITIKIKEAFTPAEILAAGMITESNGRPLRSGGMIYINAVSDRKEYDLLKPIKISIQNNYYDADMQVFKGNYTDSGTVNWTAVASPDTTTPQASNWILGKSLFMSRCASCHYIFKDGTGPALWNAEAKAGSRQMVREFVKNNFRAAAKYKYYRDALFYSPTSMTLFEGMVNDREIDLLLDYIKTESKKNPAEVDTRPPADSSKKFLETAIPTDTAVDWHPPCPDDTVYLPVPKYEQSFFSVPGNTPEPTDTATPKPGSAESMEGLRGGFTDPNPTQGMYNFEIKTLGWYNIDAYVEGYTGTENVKLWVQLQMEFKADMHVYLFCPKNKTLSVKNSFKDGKFYFDKINGGIPLFLNERAILFAFGSVNDKMYYGISEFRIQGEQTIEIKVKETTETEIREALFSRQLDGIDLGIEKKEKKIIKRDCEGAIVADDTLPVK